MDDIYTGNGVSELINLSMQALLNDGDEILIPAPDYPLWTATATLAGGKVVHYICDEESDWNPDIADIRSKITDKTKAIVIINPNNPTGALYSKEILEEIVKVAEEFGLIIFSDEIYDRLVMDGLKHISIASIAPKNVFCVTFSGLSKSHMIAGFRVGWMVLSGNKKRQQVISRESRCFPICVCVPMYRLSRSFRPHLVAIRVWKSICSRVEESMNRENLFTMQLMIFRACQQ